MGDWQNFDNSPRVNAVKGLVAQLEQNDSLYLNDEIDREKWLETARAVDEKLAVAGLRMAVRPWIPAK
jgi:hypothetical protein